MFMKTRRGGGCALGAAALLAVMAVATGAPTTTVIPLDPHGDAIRKSAGLPLAMSPSVVVVSVEGPDGATTSPDDRTLVVTGLPGAPTVTPVKTPFLTHSSGRPCRLSATSCLLFGAGLDDRFDTADDVVWLITGVGSTNDVTSIPTGFVPNTGGSAPIRLSATSAVLLGHGPDGTRETADDEAIVLTDLGGANVVTRVGAPGIKTNSYARPIPLTPTSVLVPSCGPDLETSTADDVVLLFSGVGGAISRTDIPTPRLSEYASGRPARVTGTRAVLAGTGDDGEELTADDGVYLLDGLGSFNTVTWIPTGPIMDYAAGRPAAISADVVALVTSGPDEDYETADDQVTVISGLGTTNQVTHLPVPYIDQDNNSRPLRLSPTTFVVHTNGPDGTQGSPDDRFAVITDAGGTNTVGWAKAPGLSYGSATVPIAHSGTSFLVRCGGPDGELGTGGDDAVAFAQDVTTVPATDLLDGGNGDAGYMATLAPVRMSGGCIAVVAAGLDASLGEGGDDELRVIDGIPEARDLTLSKLWIKFKAARPDKGERLQVKGVLTLDTPELFACDDVTISIGNTAQTIPAAAFTQNRKGWLKYKDRRRENGFIKSLVWKPRNGKLTIVGKGLGTGAETTDPGYVPVVVECAELFMGDAVEGTLLGKGIKYKAPR